MNFYFDKEMLDKMTIEQLKDLESKLWDERKKVVAILKYKQVMKQ